MKLKMWSHHCKAPALQHTGHTSAAGRMQAKLPLSNLESWGQQIEAEGSTSSGTEIQKHAGVTTLHKRWDSRRGWTPLPPVPKSWFSLPPRTTESKMGCYHRILKQHLAQFLYFRDKCSDVQPEGQSGLWSCSVAKGLQEIAVLPTKKANTNPGLDLGRELSG